MAALGFILIATAVCVFFDAKSIGIGHVEPSERSFLDQSPLVWALACLLLWIIAFPLYLVYRKQLTSRRSRQRGTQAFSTEAIEKLASLRDRGVITEEEFQHQKSELLND